MLFVLFYFITFRNVKRNLIHFIKKKEYTKKLNGQKNEYMNLKNELVNEKFDTERQCVFIIRNDVDCIHNESKLLLKVNMGK